ncbi:hypothetical protein A2154_00510 [Candidatus Gottesmanbacteria bacterium RBG_16_43_7]|uniref:Uncharacterized protein n=1 Tax=Candidatus Gottesmanbacteria bacterium RBG_16_43_7 TaxID=1798373 RepID=A0A1F5Z812_9BACT|nr:MAG: hypothetical protein A2154_00510 [Candidatus Gottesmanbacteria bacterium RBG_16_43_7]
MDAHLPKSSPASGTGNPQATSYGPVQPPAGSGTGTKERESEPTAIDSEHLPLTERSADVELPPAVIKSGVKLQPASHPVPPQLTQAGVVPIGDNVIVGSGSTVSLPLTSAQISSGLKQGVTSSIRWLAEWCLRRIKMVQLSLMKPRQIH